ncbi:MAG TPA: hypothetical protein VMI94_02725 [Bryobacteraceae bacterium]|nr:hypothetical protein [Bryobacteraceae bacterium]
MTQPANDRWQGRYWDLPPLILYPFDRALDSAALFDSIKLSLYRNGMAESDLEKEPLLRGRYTEFRMLCLVGKDVMRWIGQCMDFAGRDEVLAHAGIVPQNFADLLVHSTPAAVGARFESWGVAGYRQVLSRAIGVGAVFPDPPAYGTVSANFLEQYYAYADHFFACYLSLSAFTPFDPDRFQFSLYTSDEYLSTLECGPDDRADPV